MLDGGLPAWKEQGLPLDSSPVDEAAVRAPADAAQQQQAAPQATSSYKAKLQVGWAVALSGSEVAVCICLSPCVLDRLCGPKCCPCLAAD